ncbi:beta-lactamase family protein [Jatrophihabitans sp. GAS493]|uniref:MBL fold metallo-hydrolase n=1 Tax=Jatrophihabitans sp. GAS493 TaxID=1907575 RepID=UPI000BC02E92|nr:MBL fold metallo-hydrolase [Jatrophihabitans sp. GAS493]SOD70495.1 beta-lactamase family protein [Jatrophihabitans sp. GAS493]
MSSSAPQRPPGDEVSVSWWGHATTTIELAGCRVLTDPLFATRLAHLRRVGGPAPGAQAHRADVVVISHLHRDHLHIPSLAVLPASTRIIAPRGAAAAVAGTQPQLADRFEEIEVGDSVDVGLVRIEAVPAAHDGRRAPGSRFRATTLGYRFSVREDRSEERARTGANARMSASEDQSTVREDRSEERARTGANARMSASEDQSTVREDRSEDRSEERASARVWFAGDTGLFDGMREIGPVQVAVVPVGGWGPTLGDMHLDPAQACEAVRRVGASDAVPIHFGTYWPTGLRRAHPTSFRRLCQEPGTRFVTALAADQPQTRAHLLALGQRVDLPTHR